MNRRSRSGTIDATQSKREPVMELRHFNAQEVRAPKGGYAGLCAAA